MIKIWIDRRKLSGVYLFTNYISAVDDAIGGIVFHMEFMVMLAHMSFWELFSQVLGWAYFLCWTVSFYPQVLLMKLMS
jgi:hypothetical protein